MQLVVGSCAAGDDASDGRVGDSLLLGTAPVGRAIPGQNAIAALRRSSDGIPAAKNRGTTGGQRRKEAAAAAGGREPGRTGV